MTAPTPSQAPVIIAGGGMAGLTAAISLLRHGIDCEVYEQSPELRELGAGIWLSANGTRILFDLGMQPALDAVNLPPDDRVVRLWNTGEHISVYNREGTHSKDHVLYMVMRADLQRIMVDALEALKPGALHLDARIASYEQDADGVRVTLGNGQVVRGRALVGADGVHSRVRAQTFGEAQRRFTDAVTWRGLAPMSRLTERHRAPVAATWVGPTAHVTSFPVNTRQGMMMSFSGQVDRTQWEEESWSVVGSLDECLRDFAGWHDDITALFKAADRLYKWGIFVREPLNTWSQGRVTLLGDACHSMTPYLGQGLNMALEDACILTRCLQAQPDDVPAALKRYESVRVERAQAVAAASFRMLPVFHNAALANPDTAMQYMRTHWSGEEVRKRYDWIVTYDARTVAI